jgi:hypothetical protein
MTQYEEIPITTGHTGTQTRTYSKTELKDGGTTVSSGILETPEEDQCSVHTPVT